MKTEPEGAARLLNAVAFAAHKHRDQRRKGEDKSPYVNHPIEVAELLAGTGGVGEMNVLMAAVLHDTIEDTDTTLKELEAAFGSEVRALVEEVTDDKSLPKDVRKRLQIEHAARLSDAAKLIKLADKIANVRDMTDHPPSGWPLQRRLEYLDWAERVMAGCRGVNGALEKLFDAVLKRARETDLS
ncbi:MAG: bifunctional (p)ppGpp synthetase/guanosine-3',5'-bis(diphosphate) 3'-pyrophosphohydrolase [Gammaproteobacteria bacterium]|nr:bifunctional (p)ppGpp synthetase/guanosine-3',5'-bis(diphosphate) 3'-pyrophosphohydrolase [Gammaproteobacteria bacterium]